MDSKREEDGQLKELANNEENDEELLLRLVNKIEETEERLKGYNSLLKEFKASLAARKRLLELKKQLGGIIE